MIAPNARLIWLCALVIVPLCGLATAAPRLFAPCLAIGFVLAVVAAVDAFLGRKRMAEVSVTAPDSLKWFKGRKATFLLGVAGAKPGAKLEASLDLPRGISALSKVAMLHQDARSLAFACQPEARGRYRIEQCFLRTDSPLALWTIRGARAIATEIRVFPDLEQEPGAKLLMLRKTGGLRTQRVIGRGRDFERLRDYTPGDTYDEIAWKASARRGRPIVKVFQVERTQDVVAIIDSSRLGARRGAVEQFVRAALMLAVGAENNGDNFGLATFSDRVDRFVPPGHGKTHFSRCRDAIFDLEPALVSPDFGDLFAFLQLRLRRRSLLFFLTDLADPMLAEAFLDNVHVLSRRHLVVVSRLSDGDVRPLFTGPLPANADEIGARLASHLEWGTLKDLERNLKRLGVRSIALRPGSAGLDLVRQYDETKRRQAV